MSPKPPKNNPKQTSPFFLILLPFLVVFDLFMYFMTRSTCWNCFGVNDFIRDSSVSFHILSQVLPFLRDSLPQK